MKRADPIVFTLIPRGMRMGLADLENYDPRLAVNQLRSALNRAGAQTADGWLIASIHGEFDPTSCMVQLHFHGAASGDMIKVLEKIRKRRQYRSKVPHQRGDNCKEPVLRRLQMSRQPLYNLPYPLTYIFQSWWPQRARHGEDDDQFGQLHRTKWRVVDPYHTQILLWLDRWSLNRITLLMKLDIVKTGLRVKLRKRTPVN